MRYAGTHYAMMENLENGLIWEWFRAPRQDEVLRFLVSEGIATARCDIQADFWTLTEKGRSVLATHRDDSAQKALQDAKEKAAEVQRLKERREDHAKAERRYRTQNKIAVIVPFATFFLGLGFEHFSGVAEAALSLLRNLF